MLGLINPTSGEVLFNGRSNPKFLREKIWPKNYVGIVPQDIFLFDGDLYQNITLEDTDKNNDDKNFEQSIELSMLRELVLFKAKGNFLTWAKEEGG